MVDLGIFVCLCVGQNQGCFCPRGDHVRRLSFIRFSYTHLSSFIVSGKSCLSVL